MFLKLISFILVGILTKSFVGVLALPYSLTKWKEGLSDSFRWLFLAAQTGKMVLVGFVVFLWFDVFLIDHTWQSLLINGLILLLIIGIIRFATNSAVDEDEYDVIAIVMTAIAGVGIVFLVIFFICRGLFGSWLADDKFGVTNVKEEVRQESMNDITHMITTSKGVAEQRGAAVAVSKKVENASYYEDGEYALSNVNGEISYLAPLEFGSFFRITAAKQVPGVLGVNAENPNDLGRFVKAPMKVIESNVFENDLNRVLRKQYPKAIIFEKHTELDDKKKPYVVVSVGHYKAFKKIRIVDGVILLDPKDGSNKFYAIGSEPKWVDRVIPKEVAHEHWEYWGRFKHGWKNQKGWGEYKDVYNPVKKNMQTVIGEDGNVYYVTDFVKETKKGESATSYGVGYTNAKTNKMVFYNVEDLATSSDAIDTVEGSDIFKNNRTWKPTFATYYNIAGQPTYLVPIVSGPKSKYQGLALANGRSNLSIVAFGKTKEEVFRKYKNLIMTIGKGNGNMKQKTVEETVTGIVEIAEITVSAGETTNLIVLKDDPTIYMIDPKSFPIVSVTVPGHTVKMTVVKTGDWVESIKEFQNPRFEQ